MTLNELRYIVAVAQERNFRRAARKLRLREYLARYGSPDTGVREVEKDLFS